MTSTFSADGVFEFNLTAGAKYRLDATGLGSYELLLIGETVAGDKVVSRLPVQMASKGKS